MLVEPVDAVNIRMTDTIGTSPAWKAWLRLRSGNLSAPALLHLATDSLAALAAAAACRGGSCSEVAA